MRSSGGSSGRRSLRRHLVLLPVLVALLGAPGADAFTTPELLRELQKRAFLYFWNEANPANGLVRDRSTSWSPGKMAATGFGFSAICIGIDHGWITRDAGRARILTALNTLWSGPQGPEPDGNIGYRGFFYHFVDIDTAVRTWESDLAPIDTALLFAGIIDAREYFSTDDPLDMQLRALADSVTHRADWSFMYDGGGITLTWTPEAGQVGPTWRGYNEAMIMYILAIGSPTHPIPPESWDVWTSSYNWSTHYGQTYINFPPLFGHQYSHCWIDFSGIQDAYTAAKGITYWENTRRATLAQRAYCIDNPFGWVGYGENVWGITASDDPGGYLAHGAPPPQHENGTLTPTAVAGSLPFAPEVVLPALHEIIDVYGPYFWSTYGLKDAFNPTLGWFASDYIGIDQGPIVLMIENYLNRSVWERFMRNPDVQRGLALAGFNPATVGVPDGSIGERPRVLLYNAPNPFTRSTTIHYRLDAPRDVTLAVFDAAGRHIRTLVDGLQGVGSHGVRLSGQGLRRGVYFYRLDAGGEHQDGRCILVPRSSPPGR